MGKVAIIDYGRGNVRSVLNAVDACGAEAIITSDSKAIEDATHIVLPGVGAFGDAMAALISRGLPEILHRQAFEHCKPFLGICLGMQLLAERGHEHGDHVGLGWLAGEVVRIAPVDKDLKIPHMGWDDIVLHTPHPLFRGLRPDNLTFYFVHSFHFRAAVPDSVIATCEYGERFIAVAGKDNIVAAQFHPEKSHDSGVEFLENFVRWKP